jgi:hypothetical protein
MGAHCERETVIQEKARLVEHARARPHVPGQDEGLGFFSALGKPAFDQKDI